MSKALRCDRCQKCFIPEEEESTMMRFANPSVYNGEDYKHTRASRFMEDLMADSYLDLCPACTIKFSFFMQGFDPAVAEKTEPITEKGYGV